MCRIRASVPTTKDLLTLMVCGAEYDWFSADTWGGFKGHDSLAAMAALNAWASLGGFILGGNGRNPGSGETEADRGSSAGLPSVWR